MVQSKLDSTVNYPEIKKLDIEDKNYHASQYEISILGKDVIIALGQSKYTFIDKNIEYFPIYLVRDGEVYIQIGVYEVMSNQVPNILDEDGDIDIDELNEPLLYSFVVNNPYIIQENKMVEDEDEDEDEDEEDEIKEKSAKSDESEEKKEENEGEETEGEETEGEETEGEGYESESEAIEIESDESSVKPIGKSLLPEQTKEEADSEKAEYVDKKGLPWIRKYMHNNNFDIVDNEAGGDCFFAIIRDGLARAGVKTSVGDLRKLLSDEANEEIFNNYKLIYDQNKAEIDSIKKQMNDIAKENKQLREVLKLKKDKEAQKQIISKSKLLKTQHDELNHELQASKRVFDDFFYMKGVDTLAKFKKLITSCNFWGDTWALSTLERILNVKIILFSEQAFQEGDLANVLNCGQLNDIVLEARGIFEPSYYIMANYTGNHYKLITYKSRGAIKFQEIPYDVKKLIVDKCLERQAGPYYIIPDFKQLKGELEIPLMIEPDVEIQPEELWTEDTVFQLYHKSASAPKPGKGSGEILGPEERKAYTRLELVPDWRRKLDNYWPAPFELDKHRWQTVEHYYQASKFKQGHPEFYLQFSLDSNSDISKDPELAKAAGSKSGKHEGIQLRSLPIKIDSGFFESRRDNEMKKAILAKFSQHPDLKDILLNTKLAKLVRFKQRSAPILLYHLMDVRRDLK